MSKPLYLHTINGQPACFDERPPATICRVDKITRDILRSSLKQIRREQKQDRSKANRGYGFEYGYIRIYLD